MNKKQFEQVKSLLLSDNEDDFQLGLQILEIKKMQPGRYFWDKLSRETFWKFIKRHDQILRRESRFLNLSDNRLKLNPKFSWTMHELEGNNRNYKIINYEEIKAKIEQRGV